MRKLPALAGALAFLFSTTPAHAASRAEMHHQLARYYHADGYIKAIGHVAYRTQYSPDPVIRHRWTRALHWLEGIRRDAAHRIYAMRHPYVTPRPTSSTSSGHWALWNCIHNGAYPGAPHEGDSATGTYTGYLQMTNPWEGRSGNWHAMGTGVYSVAESAYASHGYSRGWLYGQWPNTAPPCARFA